MLRAHAGADRIDGARAPSPRIDRRVLALGTDLSRVFAVAPQIGYIFPISDKQAFLGLRGYREFAAENRPEGWNTFLTFSISDAAPSTVTPTRRMVTK